MGILSTKTISENLLSYYIKNYGYRENEEWLPVEAINVRRFIRSGKLIILKCHIIKGTVTDKIMEYPS